jgi:hypothetical protein
VGRGAPGGRRPGLIGVESGEAVPETPKPPPEVESAVLFGHVEEAVRLYVLHTGIDEETAREVVNQLADET